MHDDDECQIFSAINNDCLLYISNSTFRLSESRLFNNLNVNIEQDDEQKTVSPQS